MRIGFLAGSSLPVHSKTLDERPLGGTETGLIRIAEILVARGHDVVVFSSHNNPPISVPKYVNISRIRSEGRFDLIVLVQDWRPILFDLPADRFWLWTGDGFEQFSNYGIGDARVVKQIEKLLVVSSFHRDSLCEASGFPPEKAFVLGNGVHLPYFEGSEERHRKRLIYTSAPYRGLVYAPPILLKLRLAHPDVQFVVISGMSLYDRDKPYQGPHQAVAQMVGDLLRKIPGCEIKQPMLQSALAREYMKSSIFFYPCSVPETCCMTALEAQAGGCALVCADTGALSETVADTGFVIREKPLGSQPFVDVCVDRLSTLLRDDDLFARFSKASIKRAKEILSWECVADRFVEML